MQDDEIVEVMARAGLDEFHKRVGHTLDWDSTSATEHEYWKARARETLAALRAHGCEVVQWRSIAEAPMDGTYVLGRMKSGFTTFIQFCAEGYWRTRADDAASAWTPTHFAILRGPGDDHGK